MPSNREKRFDNMCGICGIYNLRKKDKIEDKIIDKMLYAIRHRGPDGNNKLINEQVGLGFNRLSFLDLTGGMQPLLNEDKISPNIIAVPCTQDDLDKEYEVKYILSKSARSIGLYERTPLYEAYANLTIDCENKNIREIVHEIACIFQS